MSTVRAKLLLCSQPVLLWLIRSLTLPGAVSGLLPGFYRQEFRCTPKRFWRKLYTFFSGFLSAFLSATTYVPLPKGQCTFVLRLPYNEKNQLFGRKLPSGARPEIQHQLA